MKVLVTIVFTCLMLLFHRQQAQTVVIPDPAFRGYLVSNHGTLMNGSQELILSNASAFAGTINCSGLGISNLSGIEHFSALTSLDCSNNSLTQVPDLSGLNALQTLTCHQNQLTKIEGLDGLNSLAYLTAGNNLIDTLPDLSPLTNLKVLNIANNKLQSIPGLSTLAGLTHLYCHYNELTNLESLNSLNALRELVCKNNRITELPSLANCTALEYLDVSANPLATLPSLAALTSLKFLYAYHCSLTSIPSLQTLSALQVFDVNDNQLATAPDFSSNSNLITINLSHNKLHTLYPISSLTLLTSLSLQYNQLTFEDLELLITHPQFSSFTISPQDTIGTKSLVYVKEFEQALLSFPIDDGISTNRYLWSKDQTSKDTTATNGWTIDYAQAKDEGVYYCKVQSTLPELSGLTLFSRSIRLEVEACTDQLKNCYPVITPDGDGINDEFYVKESGRIQIISKDGKLIKEFTAPGSWDGYDKSGQLVTMGVYGVIVNNKAVTNVTVIR